MKIVYFAWIRERIGIAEESVALPAGIVTVSDPALQAPEIVRVALDQEHCDHSDPIGNVREIALFPPMTGG